MTAAAKQLLKQAMSFSVKEREKLADALWASCDEDFDPADLDPELVAEVQRRSAELDSGTAKFTTWENIRDGLHKKYGSKA